MQTTSYTDFRKNLKYYMHQVNDTPEPLTVTSPKFNNNIVVLSVDTYESIMETLAIVSNTKLMERIKESDWQLTQYGFKQHKLLEINMYNEH
jgi:antitoxin YefM